MPLFMEKAMATHSSTLAWEIPRTEEPRDLQYMGSQRIKYDLAAENNNTHSPQEHIEHSLE